MGQRISTCQRRSGGQTSPPQRPPPSPRPSATCGPRLSYGDTHSGGVPLPWPQLPRPWTGAPRSPGCSCLLPLRLLRLLRLLQGNYGAPHSSILPGDLCGLDVRARSASRSTSAPYAPHQGPGPDNPCGRRRRLRRCAAQTRSPFSCARLAQEGPQQGAWPDPGRLRLGLRLRQGASGAAPAPAGGSGGGLELQLQLQQVPRDRDGGAALSLGTAAGTLHGCTSQAVLISERDALRSASASAAYGRGQLRPQQPVLLTAARQLRGHGIHLFQVLVQLLTQIGHQGCKIARGGREAEVHPCESERAREASLFVPTGGRTKLADLQLSVA
jgi:hypothetical protein